MCRENRAILYNEKLAQRIRKLQAATPDVTSKNMFGGLSFLIRGNMFCGVIRDDLVVRIGPNSYERTLTEPHVRLMDFTGRPIKTMVFVGPEGYQSEKALKKWIKRGIEFAMSLPPK